MEEHHEREAVPAERQRPGEPAAAPEVPGSLLDLHRAIGNRAFTRLLAREDVEVKKRFDLPVRHYTQDQVRALYLGIGIVYWGDAVWNEKSASWVVDRSQVIDMPAGGPAKKGAKGLPTEEDVASFENILDDILRSESLPEEGTASDVDDYTTPHLNAVKAVINFYLLKAWYSKNEAGEGPKSTRDVLIVAGGLITRKRQSSSLASQSLILRDAQRYFYGRLAVFMDNDEMEARSSQGLDPLLAYDPLSDDPQPGKSLYLDKPDPKGIDKMKGSTAKYEIAKKAAKAVGTDLNASQYPSSAPGGGSWLRKGTDDSVNDTAGGKYRRRELPTLVK